ncbi:MAG: DUF2760 domain-containing protein [Myxococcales bacterium]|jgi:hypothetical protein|nr:DUF2760 domain-containing protein [Myxococcales bacterium]
MNFAQRFCLAFVAFFSILFNRELAGRFRALRAVAKSPELPAPEAGAEAERSSNEQPASSVATTPHRDALHLLAIFQREGRLIDFLQEDIGGFADAEIGVAARAVHAGCKKALDTYLPLAPVMVEAEGSEVVIGADCPRDRVTLTGNLTGVAPFRGQLCHRGWQVTQTRLPEVTTGKDLSIVAPAEVELP